VRCQSFIEFLDKTSCFVGGGDPVADLTLHDRFPDYSLISMLLAFLKSLRATGQALLDPPQGELLPAVLSAGGLQEEDLVIAELEPWFLEYRLQVPGDPLPFHPEAALWGAKWLFRASCFYTFREIVEQEVRRSLDGMINTMPDSETPAAHLSADLLLQYLPEIHNRCQRLSTDDILTVSLQDLAGRLPLSGVGVAERTLLTEHPIYRHEGIKQFVVERAIDLKCNKTFELTFLKQLAISKLGAYTDQFGGDLLQS